MHAAPVTATPPRPAAELRQAWQALLETENLRARDAARRLGVSEAELVDCQIGVGAVRLDGDWRTLMARIPALGTVMALTRNEHCVHEKVGPYLDVSHDGMTGLVLGELIDLRVFYARWRFGYALTSRTPRGDQRSLQFFDAHGVAIHKIFLKPESDKAAWDRVVEDFAAADQLPGIAVEPAAAGAPERPDAEVDVAGLRTAWAAMTDTHEFFPLLRRFKVSRTQALRLAEPRFARPLLVASFERAVTAARDLSVPVMVFVGNPGMIQIHTGPVANLKTLGEWFNVMDPDFNLHLHQPGVASAWLVRKPTSDGIVTSVELFDAAGENILLLFGKRKPGIPESEAWRALVAGIETDAP